MDQTPSARELFQNLYTGVPPWDTGRPQPTFVQAADQITGSVLDCGCGTGENALFFASRGQRVTGIDFLPRPIEIAREKAKSRNLIVNFLVMDALELDSFPEIVDNAIDSGLFHSFAPPEQARYAAGLRSVVKPKGKVFLLCFSDKEPGTQGPRRISEAELRQAFSNGWTFESLEPARFESIATEPRFEFSPGGPQSWFAVIRRE